jgi:hypothetical protein
MLKMLPSSVLKIHVLFGVILLTGCLLTASAAQDKPKHHRPISPYEDNPFSYTQGGFQNLRYGGSTSIDVAQAVGRPPDNIIKDEQMYPVVENYIYNSDDGSGAATVFVFEGNLLVGMHYRNARNQYIDLTYMLPNNGDRALNSMMNMGYQPYYFRPQFYEAR